MRFYTHEECELWLSERERQLPGSNPDQPNARIGYPAEGWRNFTWAHWIATQLTFRKPALLWVTDWGNWEDAENWHLYYKLRHSYGDHRLLQEAPGHLFLEHEAEDLATFLQLTLLQGWDGCLLTQADYVNTVFSHEEYFDFWVRDFDPAEIFTGLGVEMPPAQPGIL